MRICAVRFPELRIEIVRAKSTDLERVPVAVVVAPPPLTEEKLLGNTRLSVVSREARALGVLPNQTIAQARARAPSLAVRVARPEEVREVLSRLAEIGLAFGATVSFSAERDVVWIDITGCAHLHARSPGASPQTPRHAYFDGETILAARLAGVIGSLGHLCAIAIADGPRVAAMLATANTSGTPLVVRPGENAAAIASLGVGALPLAPEDVRWLSKVGVRTIEQLRDLPPEGLGSRLGDRAREVLTLAAGEDHAPLTPYLPPEVPEEDVELEYGIEGSQALTFVAKTLTDRISARLRGRAMATARLELDLQLDTAMLERGQEPKVQVCLDLPAPLAQANDLLAALRPKIERLVLPAPVLGAKLRAPVLVNERAIPLSLFEPQPKAERALPRLVGELVSDLGDQAVSMLVLGDGWTPEDRSRLVPFSVARAEKKNGKKRRHLLSSVPEPSRVLKTPRPVSRDSVRITRHLSRLEAVAWWKQSPTTRSSAKDYVQAWTDEGMAWVEIDRLTGAMCVRGSFD